MVGKRRSFTEIASKLEQASELAAKGRTQKDIAHLLGVSVMTFHRWRKAQEEQPKFKTASVVSESPSNLTNQSSEQHLKQLQLENSRLRRLVTDLLLEKVGLEEALSRSDSMQLVYRKRSI